jgi:type I restriction enzyme, S subunit
VSEIPSTWTTTTIDELTVGIEQRIPIESEAFTYIDIASIDRESKRIVNPQRLIGKDAPSRARKVVQTGDILVSMTRPNLNAVTHITSEFNGQIASTGFDVLRAPEIDARWLFYIVRTRDFVERMSELVQGALYPAVRSKDVRSFKVPLAPLPEQKRIADKLDNLLARVDACRERLDRVPLILKRFRQSVLAAATSGQLTEEWREKNPDVETGNKILRRILSERKKKWEEAELAKIRAKGKEQEEGKWKTRYKEPIGIDSKDLEQLVVGVLPETWTWASADQLATTITDGEHITPKRSDAGVYLLSARNIQDGWISYDNVDYISENTHKILKQRLTIMEGDVLMSCSGTLGRSCVAPKLPEFSLVRSVAVLKPVLPMGNFISYSIRSEAIQRQIDSKKTQTAQANIFQNKIRTFAFPLPPFEEQEEIVRRVETLFAFANRLEARLEAARKRTERLMPTTLAKAFRGELAPQDPNDEPASALLERIRMARQRGNVMNIDVTLPMLQLNAEARQTREVAMLELSQIQPNHLTALLKGKGRLTPKSLYQMSQLRIDDFYEQLRSEETEGLLREVREGNESYLEAT